MGEKYHFIGIGGIGMSALARLLLQRGDRVRGSDLADSALLQNLRKEGAEICIGHNPEKLLEGARVVYTSAVKEDHPEYQKAKENKADILHRSSLLSELMGGFSPLLVTGTHGKTTTSSLLASVLIEGGFDPSFVIGGIPHHLKTNGRLGQGQYFVAEADESDGSFLKMPAFGAIVTNVEREHLDFWKSEEALKEGFSVFCKQVISKEHLFWYKEDPFLASFSPQGISYGFSQEADLRILSFCQEGFSTIFDFFFEGKTYSEVKLSLAGRHNVLNAAAVFGLALRLGVKEEKIRKALKEFKGVARRLDLKGERSSISFFDDYGHHPTEIESTLKALREAIGERRLVVLFQPHRWTRMKDLFEDFASAFDEADELILTDIYSAQEESLPEVGPKKLCHRIQQRGKTPCRYVPKEKLIEKTLPLLQLHDVVLTQGAGSISQIGEELFSIFSQQPLKKLKIALIFGGKSSEHEVSILSARNVFEALDPSLYEVHLFGITKKGRWVAKEGSFEATEKKLQKKTQRSKNFSSEIFSLLQKYDLCIPILHGPNGEDGKIQGFFEMLGLTYVGCDPASSVVCMNKAWTKYLALSSGVKTSPFIEIEAFQWKKEREFLLEKIEKELSYPLYVKPLHLGSSIGVSRVEDRKALVVAIENAFRFDFDLLVEKEIRGQEIEFAVLGNDFVKVATPGEILAGGECYDYEKKYGQNAIKTQIPARLSPEKEIEGKSLARRVYKKIRCKGLARVDFFFDARGEFWLNEVNPIPGFTAISLYPKMWENSGKSAKALMDQLVVLALHRQRKQSKCLE